MTSLGLRASQEDALIPSKQWTRVHATRRLEEEMARAHQDATHEFSILLVDFEGLGETVDRLGYAAEEDVWRRTLAFLIRELGPQDMCCRLGGDEFLLILSGKGQRLAEETVARLRAGWQPTPGSRQAHIEMGIGIAFYPAHGCSIEQLLCAADQTLHAERLRIEGIRAAEDLRKTELRRHH